MDRNFCKEITAVTPQNLNDICYEDQKVITTDLLALFYETESRRVTENFNRNIGRFSEGIHYFKLEGPVLKEFKGDYAQSVVVKITRNVNVLYLWTKRGTARHAKILDTDKAWHVFDELEEHYFNAKTEGMIQIDPSKNQPEVLQLAADLSRQVKEREVELKQQAPFVTMAKEFSAFPDSWKLGSGVDDDLDSIALMDSYNEVQKNEAIERKKREIEAKRKRELLIREKELKDLNKSEDIATDIDLNED